jgi:hypothetical protein
VGFSIHDGIIACVALYVWNTQNIPKIIEIDLYKIARDKNDTQLDFTRENLIKIEFILGLNTY